MAFVNANDTSAKTAGNQLLNKDLVKSRIQTILGELGLDRRYWSKKLFELSSAKKNIYHQGKVVGTEIDADTQRDMLKLGLKLHGDLSPDNLSYTDNRSVNIVNSDNVEDIDRIENILNTFKKIRTKNKSIASKSDRVVDE